MDEFDITYRALKDYLEKTTSVPEIRAFLDEMQNDSNRDESLECFASICKIDKDWIDEIEHALPFVADAVMENRQFVRSEGEVVPIEKVRTVGKETVVDLSKHSNYITRDPASNDGKIIPDKLLMPQKDNDYAIYENRFLYSLLVYLSQFIEIRLNEIISITGKYEAKTKFIKKLSTPLRKLSFELNFEDIHFNDPFASTRNSSTDALNTIKSCLNQTKTLLMTPLMKEVSKAPMVHSPIVKTNVFKFDHNFKESLSLYNFLQSYDKKGFTIENVVTKMTPFQAKASESFSSLVYLTGYLTYVYGNKIEDNLRKTYQEEEKRRKEEADAKLLSEIKRISRNIKDSGISTEEYILMLQKGTQVLEKKLNIKENENYELNTQVQKKVKELCLSFQEEFDEERKSLDKTIEDKVYELTSESRLKENESLAKVESIQKLLEETKHEKEQEIIKSNNEKNKLEIDYKDKISELNSLSNQKINSLNNEIEEAKKEIQKLKENQIFLEGEVNNLRAMNKKKPLKDFTEEEFFNELEREKIAFDAYFKKTWRKTKRRILKETLKIDKEEIKKENETRKAEKALKKNKKIKEKTPNTTTEEKQEIKVNNYEEK